jgi:hypothetical protein
MLSAADGSPSFGGTGLSMHTGSVREQLQSLCRTCERLTNG